MKDHSKLDFNTKCVHSGIDEYEYGSVVPPIYQTSTFKFKSAQHGASLFAGEEKGYIYTRMLNPTIEAMENAIAELEGGHKALGCASGMAATHTIFSSLLNTCDHVVCSAAVYGPTTTLLNTVMKRFGVETTFVDSAVNENVHSAIKENTKVVYVETPGNPTLCISDLEAISKIAHNHGAKVVVDNTFMSPALQNPIAFGADVVMHSLTKFLNGHADVVGGIIVVKDEDTYKHFRKTLNQLGGVIDPFNSFLVHRGLKTLGLRMQKHCENAQKVAEWLEKHPLVKSIRYPGLKSHPHYNIGKKQQKGSGGMITFEVEGGLEAGKILMNSVKLCQLAVSLGGVESLIQHPASMTHFSMGKEARLSGGITDGLVRISVGIENANDLIVDLEQALEKVNQANLIEEVV
ncbi:MAG: aminotransferase class I/II-fold pyridoxal phosphate-dependent enzyme [Ignavibacteria bacterium]|nr:aminotransferase class I/II-fold pyridoxal phosphate-dependent enzyme [Ignavibacteria bacterium]MBT8381947.1 aminotransferase class I/II-fold pyridoxal phosphate-dependent enzyme [Ignavibacteria bacterium]MBT8392784.1 aminotransferase class I/II-fold pyridoxal phosphate-dependent enzyme [Ignavibacteria bacterium]NNJ54345.1 aminotransferase class I/II-fold pyridoxal phosphate-dependent enzyme [Ignavibacteriaceae bacterium]NNL20538.1 aminotransferase class I/II-fold pyridoxal phosphate-depende